MKDTLLYKNSNLPIYLKTESLNDRTAHSEIAHYHDQIEIIVVDRGSVCCNAGGEKFDLQKGDVCFINRKQLHSLCDEKPKNGKHTILIIGNEVLLQNIFVHTKYVQPMLEDERFSHIRFEGEGSPAAIIAELVSRAEKTYEERSPGYEFDLLALVPQILKQVYMAYINKAEYRPIDRNLEIEKQMVEYIYDHYEEQLTLEEIANWVHISKSSCTKLFKEYTGISPIAFLNKHRLELSREMLRSTGDSVADIALSCGFSDQSYFNRLFLREYGVTPLGYRKGVRKNKH